MKDAKEIQCIRKEIFDLLKCLVYYGAKYSYTFDSTTFTILKRNELSLVRIKIAEY